MQQVTTRRNQNPVGDRVDSVLVIVTVNVLWVLKPKGEVGRERTSAACIVQRWSIRSTQTSQSLVHAKRVRNAKNSHIINKKSNLVLWLGRAGVTCILYMIVLCYAILLYVKEVVSWVTGQVNWVMMLHLRYNGSQFWMQPKYWQTNPSRLTRNMRRLKLNFSSFSYDFQIPASSPDALFIRKGGESELHLPIRWKVIPHSPKPC